MLVATILLPPSGGRLIGSLAQAVCTVVCTRGMYFPVLGQSRQTFEVQDGYAMFLQDDDLLRTQGPQYSIDMHDSEAEVIANFRLSQGKVVRRF